MALELVSLSDQDIVSAAFRNYQIIRHQSVATLYEIQNTFGFSDAALAGEEESNAENIGE
jgi:hypothetical protein